ncbi:hypothetical protein Q604_UNBC04675G0001, partial [human gut metagenome]
MWISLKFIALATPSAKNVSTEIIFIH